MRRLRLRPRLDGRLNRSRFLLPRLMIAARSAPQHGRVVAAVQALRVGPGAFAYASVRLSPDDAAVFVNQMRFSVQPLELNVRSLALFPNRGASRHIRIPARMIQSSRTELAGMLIVIAKAEKPEEACAPPAATIPRPSSRPITPTQWG